jgi:predicted nucleic acid-binding protein
MSSPVGDGSKVKRKIMQSVDPGDVPFIAAAPAIEDESIWTDDDHFRRQKKDQDI